MKQKLVLFGFFLFGILYFSNKKGVKKMVPTIVLKYKELFMGLAVGLVAYAVLHKDVVEGVGSSDVRCGARWNYDMKLCSCQEFLEERCGSKAQRSGTTPCECSYEHLRDPRIIDMMARGRLTQCGPGDVTKFAESHDDFSCSI